MRKLHISSGLALLLLLAQQGAVLHEVGHISQIGVGAKVQAGLHADTVLDNSCKLCLAFSQVANPAGNTVGVTQFEPLCGSVRPTAARAVTPRDIPTPRSRGPPASRLSV